MNINFISAIIGIISGILGIISYFLWYRGFWKYIGYSIWVRLLNRKPMVFDIILTIKYDTKPSQKLNYSIFNQFKNTIDNKNVKITKQKTRPENISFLITDKNEIFWFPLSIFFDEEPDISSCTENENKIISYNITIRLSHKLSFTWKQLDLIEDLSNYINSIKNILKYNLYEEIKPRMEFFVCTINKGFSITEIKKEKKDFKLGAKKIVLNKENISIIGPFFPFLWES